MVCAEADLAKAAPAICEHKFECAGQNCNASIRGMVARPIYEESLSRMKEAAREISVSPPDDSSTNVRPTANVRRIEAMERLTSHPDEGHDRGENASLVAPRADPDDHAARVNRRRRQTGDRIWMGGIRLHWFTRTQRILSAAFSVGVVSIITSKELPRRSVSCRHKAEWIRLRRRRSRSAEFPVTDAGTGSFQLGPSGRRIVYRS
ncbi:aldehyde dehydrogenase family protein [Bradyrhizobium archetypum]|uniref:aldehyde dehydrogenase family protein n=1 Tax=Bradyrhizobium archetypum TaxID=2721160 RepID=UPI0035DEF111